MKNVLFKSKHVTGRRKKVLFTVYMPCVCLMANKKPMLFARILPYFMIALYVWYDTV